MIVSPRDYVFFTIDKEFADKITTASGFELDLVTGGEPGNELNHVREFGIVTSLPRSLSSYLGEMEIQVTDKIYFHFHTIAPENKHESDGKVFYKVHYGEIYCAVRDGKIIMVNDNVFCQPVMETEADIKTPAEIFLKSEPEPLPLRAKVTHINSSDELKVNDHIYYDKHNDIPIEIEGVSYYRMKQTDIIGKYEE